MWVLVWDVLETGCMGGWDTDTGCLFIVDSVCGLGGIIPNLLICSGRGESGVLRAVNS